MRDPDSLDRAAQRTIETGLLIRRGHRALRRALAARLERLGVSINQFTVLNALWHNDGLSQAELSEESEVDKATLTASINGLEAAGLVERRDHATDRRKNNVFLTAEGAALEIPVMAATKETVDRALTGIAHNDVATLRDSLFSMLDNLSDMPTRGGRR
jgi:DNA-binding MarR family transcriptional regulator